jgi:hypothetical protein
MNSIGQIPHFPHRIYNPNQFQDQTASVRGTGSFSRMEGATVFQSQETDLTIVTKEGDHVTISADSDFSLELTTYDSTGRMKGATSQLHSETLSLGSSQEFSISVEGDLNEQEITDIHTVLQSLDKIIDDFQAGRLEQVATRGEKLGTLESLSSIDATLQVEQSISVERAVLSETTSATDKSSAGLEANEHPLDLKVRDIAQPLMIENLGDKDVSFASIARKIEKFFLKLSHFLSGKGTHSSLGERFFDWFLFSR